MGWWDQKLGTDRPVAPRQSFGLNQEQFPAPVHRGYQPAPAPESQEFVPNTANPTQVSDVLPIWQWQGNPRGGAGETAKTGNCPGCGSPRYFSRTNSGGVTTSNGVVYPAPQCSDCGYPNEQGTLGVGAKMVGSSIPARQGDSSPGSLASLR